MPDKHPTITQSVFHNDDIKLTFEYPADISKFSNLEESDFIGEVEVFARIFFENIATKSKREFKIIKNEETGLHEYFIRTGAD